MGIALEHKSPLWPILILSWEWLSFGYTSHIKGHCHLFLAFLCGFLSHFSPLYCYWAPIPSRYQSCCCGHQSHFSISTTSDKTDPRKDQFKNKDTCIDQCSSQRRAETSCSKHFTHYSSPLSFSLSLSLSSCSGSWNRISSKSPIESNWLWQHKQCQMIWTLCKGRHLIEETWQEVDIKELVTFMRKEAWEVS